MPDNLRLIGISSPNVCSVKDAEFRCTFAELGAAQRRTVSLTVGSATEGSYAVSAGVGSDDLDANIADNSSVATVMAMPAAMEPPPPEPAPDPATTTADEQGGGCTLVHGKYTPPDPTLPILAGLGVFGVARRRERRSRRVYGARP